MASEAVVTASVSTKKSDFFRELGARKGLLYVCE